MKRLLFIVSLAVLMLPLFSSPLSAGWIENGTAIKIASRAQTDIDIISDGEGGAVMVWSDLRYDNGFDFNDIYAQRVDRRGNILWTSGGVPICTANYEQYNPNIVSDGAGGFIISWQDLRSGSYYNVYAQRIDLSGNILWTSNGVGVCTGSYNMYAPELLPVPGGGAFLAWKDFRTDASGDIYCQKIDNTGATVWTSAGVAVCATTGDQGEVKIADDGYNGFFAVWRDQGGGASDIYLQQMNSSGSPVYTANGVAICTATGEQATPQILSSDFTGGVFIAWLDVRSGTTDVYGTFFRGGSSYWGANGAPICSASGIQSYLVLQRYGGFEMVAAWRDDRGTDTDLYAQRCDYNGNMKWGTNGKAISTDIGVQYIQDIVESDEGSVILCWLDGRNVYHDTYVQKLDEDGDPIWDPDGVVLCDAFYYQSTAAMAQDGMGGAIVAWEDQRNYLTTSIDIYASRIDCAGYWGFPSPEISSIDDVPYDQGGSIALTWEACPLDVYPWQAITHYSIWRSLTGFQTAALLSRGVKETALEAITPDFEGSAYRFLKLGAATYGWEWLANMDTHRLESYSYTAHTLYDSTGSDDGWHHFFVASHTADPFVYWDSEPDSGYSVDNISPAMPMGLAGEQQYSPEGLRLAWDPNSEIDLAGYNIYRGISGDFEPGEGNLVASTPDTTTFDGDWTWEGGYYYKLAAVDIHGNKSPFSLLTPSQITGDDTPPAPLAYFMNQNFPNPFNPSTTISFGLREAGNVTLRIYDASGRLVRALIDRHFDAGSYNVLWDGRGCDGGAVASGVYFYNIEAGTFRETRKMVLLK